MQEIPEYMIRGLADKMKGAELPKSFPQPIKLTVSSGNPIPLIPEIRETPNGFEITTVQVSDYNAKTSLSFIEIHKK
jgi:hypothetical protein